MNAFSQNLRQYLLHPWYLLALLALVANDRVLKEAFPGLITGKLSDFAGVFVLAVALGAGFRRPTAAVIATGLGFAAIKLSVDAAVLAAPILGGVTLQDSTDLVALLILLPAHRFLTSERLGSQVDGPTESLSVRVDRGFAEQFGPVDPRVKPSELVRRVGLTVTLAATAFAVTATSCSGPSGYRSFMVVPDGVVAVGDEGFGDGDEGFADHISTDGGRTWQLWEGSSDGQPSTATEACLDGDRCFRVIPGQRVEQRTADGWTTAFEHTDDEFNAVTHQTGGCSGPELFQSIIAIDAGSDSTVLVAMGNDGVLRLDPGDGSWTRIGIGKAQPKDVNAWVPGDLVRTLVFLTPLAVAGLSLALLLIRRNTAGARWRVTAFVVTVVGALGLQVVSLLSSLSLAAAPSGVFRFAAGVAIAAIVLGAAALAAVLLAPRPSTPASGPPAMPAPTPPQG